MISRKSWESFRKISVIGKVLSFYTFYFVFQSKHYQVVAHIKPKRVELLTLWFLLVNLIAIPALTVVAVFFTEDTLAKVFFSALASGFFLVAGLQAWAWNFRNEIPCLVSKFAKFQRHLCKDLNYSLIPFRNCVNVINAGKVHRVPLQCEKDGYESILDIINRSFLYLDLGLIPGVLFYTFFTENEITAAAFRCFSVILSYFGLSGEVNLILTNLGMFCCIVLGCAGVINGNFNIQLFVNFAIFYTNSTRLWMRTLR